jgi:hypothetical protein
MGRAVFALVIAAIGIGVVAPNMGAESVAQAGTAEANQSLVLAPEVPNDANMGGESTTMASIGVKPSGTPVIPEGAKPLPAGGHCPSDMVEVEGDYCPWIEQKCLRWLDPETKMRCAEFAPSSKCQSKTVKKHFCIDRYEWPNKVGEKPMVMGTWYDAEKSCKSAGKRLCGDSEWTLACEGEERLPYPYGYARNADACNIDKPHPDVNEQALGNPATRDAEAARLDQRDTSGSHESCVSPYGVFDMTGNVDEWVVNESGAPYKSGLKGGYWGPVRTRCRPMTTAHYEGFSFYQIGFRCCGEPSKDTVVAPSGPAGQGTGGIGAGAGAGKGAPGSAGAAASENAPQGALAGS